MRRRGLLLLMFVLAAAVVAHAQQQWVEYRPGAGYRVEFPGQPTVESHEVNTAAGIITMHVAKVDVSKDIELATMHTSYPKGAIGDPMNALGMARDSVVNLTPSRTLRSEQNLSMGGAPAKRVIVDDPDRDEVIIQLMVVSGNDFYQAIISSSQGSENSPEAQRFLSSFALVAR